MRRRDSVLVEWLARKDIVMAKEWQKLPYVEMPGDVGWDAVSMPDLTRMPWYEFILDCTDTLEHSDAQGAISHLFFSIKHHKSFGSTGPGALVVAFAARGGRVKSPIAFGLAHMDGGIGLVRVTESVAAMCDDNLLNELGGRVLASVNYLQTTPKYVTTVAPNKKLSPQTRKIWRREDLSKIVFIDPTTMREHRGDPKGGTHASPSPHNRRGHWRRLDKDDPDTRKVFVRPAWVGPTEWQFRGSTYRVITRQQTENYSPIHAPIQATS